MTASLAYTLYLAVAIATVAYVATIERRAGEPFYHFIMRRSAEVRAASRLAQTTVLLFLWGASLLMIPGLAGLDDAGARLETAVLALGKLHLILAFIHYARVANFLGMRRRAMARTNPPPHLHRSGAPIAQGGASGAQCAPYGDAQ